MCISCIPSLPMNHGQRRKTTSLRYLITRVDYEDASWVLSCCWWCVIKKVSPRGGALSLGRMVMKTTTTSAFQYSCCCDWWRRSLAVMLSKSLLLAPCELRCLIYLCWVIHNNNNNNCLSKDDSPNVYLPLLWWFTVKGGWWGERWFYPITWIVVSLFEEVPFVFGELDWIQGLYSQFLNWSWFCIGDDVVVWAGLVCGCPFSLSLQSIRRD